MNEWKNKNYYFNIFEQYSISNYWEINSTSPDNKAINNWESLYSKGTEINPFYIKFQKLKNEYKETKEENIKKTRKK